MSARLASGDFRDFANREILAKIMTPAQIAEAQRLAREWVRSPIIVQPSRESPGQPNHGEPKPSSDFFNMA